MLLFTFVKLFDILYPFHRPAVEGCAAGLAGKVVERNAQDWVLQRVLVPVLLFLLEPLLDSCKMVKQR